MPNQVGALSRFDGDLRSFRRRPELGVNIVRVELRQWFTRAHGLRIVARELLQA
jgi:hypothetical protein